MPQLRCFGRQIGVVILMLASSTPNFAFVLEVGPGKQFSLPSMAATAAMDGDTVVIAAGDYAGDVAVWQQNYLTLRGLGGLAHLTAQGAAAEDKAIWVIKGNHTTVENIEFSHTSVSDHNGAGIRQEGAGLLVRNCYFHDNDNGILAGDNPNSEIRIEFSHFAHNGFGDGYSHNIYINTVQSFTLQYCYVHHAKIGHNVKSRALVNYILYNRIMDEADGTSSYAIDLPEGGTSYIIGNSIQQGPATDNYTLISYGEEGLSRMQRDLYIINNTLVNDYHDGKFISIGREAGPAKIINNIFVGPGRVLTGPGALINNLGNDKAPGLVSRATFDYHLSSTSKAIDAGIDPGNAQGFSLSPIGQYVHLNRGQKRPKIRQIDLGAFEYMMIQ